MLRTRAAAARWSTGGGLICQHESQPEMDGFSSDYPPPESNDPSPASDAMGESTARIVKALMCS